MVCAHPDVKLLQGALGIEPVEHHLGSRRGNLGELQQNTHLLDKLTTKDALADDDIIVIIVGHRILANQPDARSRGLGVGAGFSRIERTTTPEAEELLGAGWVSFGGPGEAVSARIRPICWPGLRVERWLTSPTNEAVQSYVGAAERGSR